MTGSIDDIVFCINGSEYCLKRDSDIIRDSSLNDFIRRKTPFKGTKLACGEGGCGSCAVQIAHYDPKTGKERFTTINSCLCPVGSVDGASITTVEGIGNSKAGYHAVQEAFCSNYALQCGACTPGFITSTHAAIKKCHMQGTKPTVERIQQGLDGNLCRCTGYRPILDACRELTAHPDVEDLCKTAAACGTGAFPERLKQHVRWRSPHRTQGSGWSTPTSLRALLQQLDDCKGSVRLVAGNTGFGIYKEWLPEDHLIDVKEVPELRRLSLSKEGLVAGGAVTIEELILGLQGKLGSTPEAFHRAAEHLLRIAGTHVRAAASIGGNLALLRERALQSNLAPVLVALEATVTVTSLHSQRSLPILELVYGEHIDGMTVVQNIHIPMPPQGMYFWGHKLAKRYVNAHALVDLCLSAVFDPPLGSSGPASTKTVQEVCIVISTPTVIEKGVAGLQCGPDKVEWRSMRACGAEAALRGNALTVDALVTAMEELQHDISPGNTPDGGTESFYRSAAEGLLLQALAPLLAGDASLPPKLQRLLASAKNLGDPGVAKGKQTYPDYSGIAPPAHENVEKDRVHLMTSGEALYTSDVGLGGSELHAVPVLSTQALATLEHIDASRALKMPGVAAWVSAKDVPGENKVKGGASDSPIFADDKVEHMGQVIGLIIADTPRRAQDAAAKVSIQYGHPKELGDPIITIPAAIQNGSYYTPPGSNSHETLIRIGNADSVIAESPLSITAARYQLPSQQHMYMETQCSVAEPDENGGMSIVSSTQTLDGVQSAAARALGIPCHAVTASCRRVGGAFGGKVARSMPVAAAAAVAAAKTGRRVRYSLNRNDDMRINGGRSETMVEYDVGFKASGEITALKIRGYFLCGAFLDLGFNDMMVLQQGVDQAYDFKHMSLDLYIVRTNLNPRTIMRSPGFVNSVMIIEQIMEHVAEVSGVDPVEVRRLNFLKAYPVSQAPRVASTASTVLEGSSSTTEGGHAMQRKEYGCSRLHQWPNPGPAFMKTSLGRQFEANLFTLPRVWEELIRDADYYGRLDALKDFNKANAWRKRGISITPCRFDAAPPPISASVSIYHDGSVLIVSGGQEMGQGLHTKLKQIASYELGQLLPKEQQPLPLDLLRTGDSRSDVVPNGGPSWSSTTSEAAVAAVSEACKQLVKNLSPHKQEGERALDTWRSTVESVHSDVGYAPAMAMLSAYGFYNGQTRSDPGGGPAARSGLKDSEALAYCTFGAACSEVELDVLTGEQRVLRCDILFDCGRSINPALDMGQVEGAFIQGLGLFTSEEVITDSDTGRLITDGTWEYKIPAATCIPRQFNPTFLKDSPNTRGVMGSKASGEPSLLLSVSVLHALRAAVKAARREVGAGATRADLQAQRGGQPPCCARARGSFSPAEHAYKQLQLKFLTRSQPLESAASPAELHEVARKSARRYLTEPSRDPELSSPESMEQTEEFFSSAAGKHATHHAGYALGLTDALPGPCPVADRAGARQRVRRPVADRASTPADRARKFVELPGPASVIRLREACGPFSAAKILRTAMEDAELTQQAVDDWVLMQPGDLSQLAVG